MNNNAPKSVQLEEIRLREINDLDDYDMFHERHRIFPSIFEERNHKNILDVAAGVGVVGKRIKELYKTELVCNDISPKCLSILRKNDIKTVSFNLDDEVNFPFEAKSFGAVIALATIEHIFNTDHFVSEIHRILADDGVLYMSAPNYNGILYLLKLLTTGKTFHDPLSKKDRYEFYAHIRYFTYRSLIEYLHSFGFEAISVYLPVPKESTNFIELKKKSKLKAFIFKLMMTVMYFCFSPRWASEPVLCFQKRTNRKEPGIKKIKKKIV